MSVEAIVSEAGLFCASSCVTTAVMQPVPSLRQGALVVNELLQRGAPFEVSTFSFSRLTKVVWWFARLLSFCSMKMDFAGYQ